MNTVDSWRLAGDNGAKMRSKTLTIMFTDIKNYVSQTASHSRRQLEKFLELQDKAVRPVIKKHGGRLVKTIGDAYMVVFESPTSAVLCGQEIQDAVADHFKLRIGINTGEVNLRGDDIFGEPVNLASRLESAATPGDVFFTEAVYLAMNRNEAPAVLAGNETFKGISREVKIYRIGKPDLAMEIKSLNLKKYFLPLTLGMIILGLLAINWSTYRWQTSFRSGLDGTESGRVLSSEVSDSNQEGTSDFPQTDSFEITAPAIESGLFDLEFLTPTPTSSPTPTPEITPTETPTPTPKKNSNIRDFFDQWRQERDNWRR